MSGSSSVEQQQDYEQDKHRCVDACSSILTKTDLSIAPIDRTSPPHPRPSPRPAPHIHTPHRIAAAIPYYPFKGIDRFYDISGLLLEPALFQRTVDILMERYKGMAIDKIGGFDARGFVLGPPLALALNCPFFMLRKKGKMPNVICGEAYSKVRAHPLIPIDDFCVGPEGCVRQTRRETPPSASGRPPFPRPPLPLPTTQCTSIAQEYEADQAGGDQLCISRTAVSPGERVLLIDDLIATGGTLLAGVELVKRQQVWGRLRGWGIGRSAGHFTRCASSAVLCGGIQGVVVEAACMIELAFLKGGDKVID